MRAIGFVLALLVWLTRLADPVLHTLAHDHHAHCHEQGEHLHEGDDSCEWTDPAFIVGVQLAGVCWQYVLSLENSLEPISRISSAKNFSADAVSLRGPPLS